MFTLLRVAVLGVAVLRISFFGILVLRVSLVGILFLGGVRVGEALGFFGDLLFALGEFFGAAGGLVELLLHLEVFQEVERAFEALLVLLLVELEVLDGLLHLLQVELLHGLLKLLEGLHQLGRVDLLGHALHLLVHLQGLLVDEVVLLHLLRHLLDLARQILDALFELLLALLHLFELALVFPVALLLAAQLIAELLELLADLLRLVEHVFEVLLGGLLGLVEGFVLLGERGQAEAVRGAAGRLEAADGVVVAHLDVVLDHVSRNGIEAGAFGQQPLVEDLLVELPGILKWDRQALELVHDVGEAALGEAPVEAEPREAEVVGEAELERLPHGLVELGHRRRLDDHDRRVGVGEQLEVVDDRVAVLHAAFVAEDDLVGALAAQHERPLGAAAVERERIEPAIVEADERLGELLPGHGDVQRDARAGQRRHVADVRDELLRRDAGVAREGERHLERPHDGPLGDGGREPAGLDRRGRHAVAERAPDVRERVREAARGVGHEADLFLRLFALIPEHERDGAGQLAARSLDGDVERLAFDEVYVARLDGEGEGRRPLERLAGGDEAGRGAEERARRRDQKDEQADDGHRRQPAGAPRPVERLDLLEGHSPHLLAEHPHGTVEERRRRVAVAAVGEVEEVDEAV